MRLHAFENSQRFWIGICELNVNTTYRYAHLDHISLVNESRFVVYVWSTYLFEAVQKLVYDGIRPTVSRKYNHPPHSLSQSVWLVSAWAETTADTSREPI